MRHRFAVEAVDAQAQVDLPSGNGAGYVGKPQLFSRAGMEVVSRGFRVHLLSRPYRRCTFASSACRRPAPLRL